MASKETEELRRQYHDANSAALQAIGKAEEIKHRWQEAMMRDAGIEIGAVVRVKQGGWGHRYGDAKVVSWSTSYGEPRLTLAKRNKNGEFGKSTFGTFLSYVELAPQP